jgi:hypothetical protein
MMRRHSTSTRHRAALECLKLINSFSEIAFLRLIECLWFCCRKVLDRGLCSRAMLGHQGYMRSQSSHASATRSTWTAIVNFRRRANIPARVLAGTWSQNCFSPKAEWRRVDVPSRVQRQIARRVAEACMLAHPDFLRGRCGARVLRLFFRLLHTFSHWPKAEWRPLDNRAQPVRQMHDPSAQACMLAHRDFLLLASTNSVRGFLCWTAAVNSGCLWHFAEWRLVVLPS